MEYVIRPPSVSGERILGIKLLQIYNDLWCIFFTDISQVLFSGALMRNMEHNAHMSSNTAL